MGGVLASFYLQPGPPSYTPGKGVALDGLQKPHIL